MDSHARAREPVRTHAGARVKDITIRYKSDFAPYTSPNKNEETVKSFTDMWRHFEQIDRDRLMAVANLNRNTPGGSNAKP